MEGMKAPQSVENEYDKMKSLGFEPRILFNATNNNFFVSIFPLSLLKQNLFISIVK